jgi:hypothetical protein
MADTFITITRQTATKWLVTGKRTDSQNQLTTKFDFSGANSITVDFANFVTLASRLTNAQQDDLARLIINFVIDALTPAGA